MNIRKTLLLGLAATALLKTASLPASAEQKQTLTGIWNKSEDRGIMAGTKGGRTTNRFLDNLYVELDRQGVNSKTTFGNFLMRLQKSFDVANKKPGNREGFSLMPYLVFSRNSKEVFINPEAENLTTNPKIKEMLNKAEDAVSIEVRFARRNDRDEFVSQPVISNIGKNKRIVLEMPLSSLQGTNHFSFSEGTVTTYMLKISDKKSISVDLNSQSKRQTPSSRLNR